MPNASLITSQQFGAYCLHGVGAAAAGGWQNLAPLGRLFGASAALVGWVIVEERGSQRAPLSGISHHLSYAGHHATEPGRRPLGYAVPHEDRANGEDGMRKRLGLPLAASGAAATLALTAQPAFAAGHGGDGGATIEEFVCFRSAGDRIALGTGKVTTTPSGNAHVVCTGQPL